jgi:hypothetical protein
MPLTLATPAHWQRHLRDLGFTRARDHDVYRLNGTLFTTRGGWPTLQSSRAVSGADSLRGQIGKPGLWKLVRSPDRGIIRLFEMPPRAAEAEDPFDGEEPDRAAADCLTWAMATSSGKLPEGWQPPARAEVERWVPAGGLTVQAGAVVRQGELIHASDRLAIRFPLLPRVPDELPAGQRAWLYETLRDGQDRWRMVRVGVTGAAGSEAAWAEVDLSGCPVAVLESLFEASLGALRWVVEWLAGPAAFLADPAVACRAVEVCPVRD